MPQTTSLDRFWWWMAGRPRGSTHSGRRDEMIDLCDQPGAVRRGEELDLARLEPFLRNHFPESGSPLRVEQFPSGHSNLTYLVNLGARQIVLRRPPFGSKVRRAHDMGREFRVLSKLPAAYTPAPK